MPFFNEDDYVYHDAPHERSNDNQTMSRIEKKLKLMAEVLDELLKHSDVPWMDRDKIKKKIDIKKIDILKGNNDD